MAGLDPKWLVTFVAQILVGAALALMGEGSSRDFGILILGGALGQGLTANMKARVE